MAHLSRLCCFSALALFITLNIQALVMNSVLVGTNSVIFAVLIVRNTTDFWLLSCVLSLSDPAPLLHCLESRKYCNWDLTYAEPSAGQIWVSQNYSCSFYPAISQLTCITAQTDISVRASWGGEIDFQRHHQSLPGLQSHKKQFDPDQREKQHFPHSSHCPLLNLVNFSLYLVWEIIWIQQNISCKIFH